MRPQKDLTRYTGCDCDQAIGLDPLAVGFLSRKHPFNKGTAPPNFAKRLLQFCHPEKTVCQTHGKRKSPFDGKHIEVELDGVTFTLGGAEIRILGEQEIYAAPDLIYHYVVDHQYQPPDEFVQAVLKGPAPNSPEFRALINTLRSF